jgi:outer membrane protein assembly factor BamE (lipoprotein component of BamABCDE complex)
MNANSMDGMNKGELQLYELLNSKEGEMFRIIPNIILDRHEEGTNQIDLLAITQKGVFVFEMKDYSGWIFGNEDNVEWTQMLNKGGFGQKKYRFRNPIKQNENHIKTVRHLLSKNDIHLPIFNVLVFGNDATLKDVTSSIDVVKLDEVLDTIDKYPNISSDYDAIANIETLILSNNKFGKEALEEHLSFIERISQPKNDEKVTSRGSGKESSSKKAPYMLWIKILFGLTVLIFGFYNPIVLLALMALLAPSKRRRRSRKSSGGIYGLVFLVVIYLWYSFGDTFINSVNDVKKSIGNETHTAGVQASSPKDEEIAKMEIWGVEENDGEGVVEIQETDEAIDTIETEEDIQQPTQIPNEPLESAEIEIEAVPVEEETIAEVQESLSELKAEETINTGSQVDLNQNNIVLGTSSDEVVSVLGEPDKIVTNKYVYKNSIIYFDMNWKVNGWSNYYNQLDQAFLSITGGTIDLGSTKKDVEIALGSPTEINSSNPFRWNYKNSYVTFNQDWKVIGWANHYNQLDHGLKSPISGVIDLGSSKDEVKVALGSPTEIVSNNQYKWNYKNSYITFNQDWKVIGWANHYNQLDHGLKSPISGVIDLNSSKDEVKVALGSPTEIVSNNQYKWNYKNSYITFDQDWKVSGWANHYNQMDHGLKSAKGGVIDLGSSREEVHIALGSPTVVVSNNPQRWNYKNSYVTFDQEWKVSGWANYYNQMDHGLNFPVGGVIDIGSSREDVHIALGSPTEVVNTNIFKWIYKNSYIIFDSSWKVVEWKNYYDQLTHVLPKE